MNTQNPLISICIPAYNAASFINETLNCWKNQSYTKLEIIVQDDCSTDETYKIALESASVDERIKVFKNSKNLGIGNNWNEAYRKVNGEYVVIFNADDIVPKNFIETLLSILQGDINLDYASCEFKYWILNKDDTYTQKNTYHSMPEGEIEAINDLLFKGYPFSHVFTLHKKTALDKLILPTNDLFITHQVCDYELWIRMGLANFKGYHTNKIFGYYRKHFSNNSSIHNAEFSGTYVVLKHHDELKNQNKNLYQKWIAHNIYYHLKNCLRHGKTPHLKSIFLLFQYYFK